MKPASNIFFGHQCLIKQETIFTSKHPTNEIIKKIEKTIMPLVFNVKKNNFNVNKHYLFLFNMQFAITLLLYTTFLSDLERKFIINQIRGAR